MEIRRNRNVVAPVALSGGIHSHTSQQQQQQAFHAPLENPKRALYHADDRWNQHHQAPYNQNNNSDPYESQQPSNYSDHTESQKKPRRAFYHGDGRWNQHHQAPYNQNHYSDPQETQQPSNYSDHTEAHINPRRAFYHGDDRWNQHHQAPYNQNHYSDPHKMQKLPRYHNDERLPQSGKMMETSFNTMPPTEQKINRNETNKKTKTKRQTIWIVLTRICAAILIIIDCVSDWMQNTDMKDPPQSVTGITKFNQSDEKCVDMDDVAQKYMYFTIAGTVLSVVQIANIIYQIYCEIKFKKEHKDNEDEDQDEKPKKILDGRTETFYTVLFIELPQAILLLRYQDVCLPGCDADFLGDKKHLKRRLTSVINGGIALLNNAWRYITSMSSCEEAAEDKGKGCCGGCLRTCFKCCCPCLCCFHRYECTIPCFLCCKKCICDACVCSCEKYNCCGDSCCSCGGCGCSSCSSGGCSDKPFVLHEYLATLVNVLYVLFYFINICNTFCVLLDTFIYKVISYIRKYTYNIF